MKLRNQLARLGLIRSATVRAAMCFIVCGTIFGSSDGKILAENTLDTAHTNIGMRVSAMPAPIGLWTFNDPDNLTCSKIGQDLTLVGNHTVVPGVDREDTAVRIGIGSHYICSHGINPTMSPGSLVNQWSLVVDFSYPPSSAGQWMCFFQTNQNNANDGDCFIRAGSGMIGVDLTGYSSLQTQPDTWYRMVVSVDNGKSYRIYIDGALSLEGTVQSVDGRFALDSKLLLFADNSAEDNPINISMVAIYDYPLTSAEAAALKGPGDRGIEQEDVKLWTEPYLQNVKKDGITIMWELSDLSACQLEYDSDTGYSFSATIASSSSGFGTWIYKSILTGLKPDTIYHYCVTVNGTPQPDKTFKTAPSGLADFSFGVWGDSQGTNQGDYPNDLYQPTKAMMAHMADRVDIAVTPGDLATDGNLYTDTRLYYLDRVAKYLGIKVPWFVAWGNHDKGSSAVIRKFNDLPSKDRGASFHPGCGSYSFEYGGCNFICIDYSDNRDMVWFESALQEARANDVRFIFVFVHQPPYCERWITGDQYGRDNLVPLMEKYGVDICFSGHTHAYNRGYQNGIYYVITGGGSWLDHAEPLKADWPQMTVGGYTDLAPGINGGLVHHYVYVEVDENGFEASLVPFHPDGSVMEGVTDIFSKKKPRGVKHGSQCSVNKIGHSSGTLHAIRKL